LICQAIQLYPSGCCNLNLWLSRRNSTECLDRTDMKRVKALGEIIISNDDGNERLNPRWEAEFNGMSYCGMSQPLTSYRPTWPISVLFTNPGLSCTQTHLHPLNMTLTLRHQTGETALTNTTLGAPSGPSTEECELLCPRSSLLLPFS
jgi:hypothetical protein